MLKPGLIALAGALLLAVPAAAQTRPCDEGIDSYPIARCRFQSAPPAPDPGVAAPLQFECPADAAKIHLLSGTACYYSASFNGRKTASGEIYRNSRFSAAHRTLPLGCWVEVRSRATGKTIRLRVNDRGPFVGGFVIDLSRAAASALGVDRAGDRWVDARVIALPGEEIPSGEPGIAAPPMLESDPASGAR